MAQQPQWPANGDSRFLARLIVYALVGATLLSFPTVVYMAIIHGETPAGLFGVSVVAIGGLVRFGIYLQTTRNGNGSNGSRPGNGPGGSTPPTP